MSTMSAPSATMRVACVSALSGVVNCPPSEKESGVTLSTPITAGVGRDSSADSIGWSAAAGLDVVAIMPSLCAVRPRESSSRMDV